MKGKTVLNAFAYTGSLGAAATGRRSQPCHSTRPQSRIPEPGENILFSNGFPINKQDFITSDFFTQVAKFKRSGERFDCVFIDPPFFATSPGELWTKTRKARGCINKVRPLINDSGLLVAINNALYVSGEKYMRTLESLCEDGYLKIKEFIPVPDDCTGTPETRVSKAITDPVPFNHSTKIAAMEVKRK